LNIFSHTRRRKPKDEDPGLPPRRIVISIERETVHILYPPGVAFTGPCAQCGHEVLMLVADAAAAVIGATPRDIYRWLEARKLHFQESPSGRVHICSESLCTLVPYHPVLSGEAL
jgi:hypothetical protein